MTKHKRPREIVQADRLAHGTKDPFTKKVKAESRLAQSVRLNIPEPTLRRIERTNSWAINKTIAKYQRAAFGLTDEG